MIRPPLNCVHPPKSCEFMRSLVNLVNFKGPKRYKTNCFVSFGRNQVHKFITPHIWGKMVVSCILVAYLVWCIW